MEIVPAVGADSKGFVVFGVVSRAVSAVCNDAELAGEDNKSSTGRTVTLNNVVAALPMSEMRSEVGVMGEVVCSLECS